MKRKVCAFVVAALLLTACSKAPVRQVTKVDAPAQVTIRLANVPGGGYEPVLDALISAFQERQPGYRVEMVPFDGGQGLSAQLEQACREGKVDVVPDLYFSSDPVRQRVLEPLSPYLGQSGLDMGRLEHVAPWLRIEGELYGLPVWTLPFALLGNKDLFEARGVPWPEKGWTWEEFRQAAVRLSQGQGENRQMALDLYLDDMARLWATSLHDGDVAAVTPQELREALTFFSTMIEVDQTAPRSERFDGIKTARPSRWLAGEAAIAQAGMGSLGAMKLVREFRWAILPTPSHPGKEPFTFTLPYNLGIPADSPYQDAAWEFIRFAAGPEGSAVTARAGFVPLYATDEARATLEGSSQPPAGKAQMLNTRWAKWWGGSQEQGRLFTLASAANRVLSGTQTVDEGIAWFEAQRQLRH